MKSSYQFRRMALVIAMILVGFSASGLAQTCYTSDEMDAATRSAIQSTASRYFDMVSRGDTATLKQNAIPTLASNFGGLEGAIKEIHAYRAGARVTTRAPYEHKDEVDLARRRVSIK